MIFRSYELLPGVLRVYVGIGEGRIHEMDVDLHTALVRVQSHP